MLDRKKPFFTESYVSGSAVFRDFYSTYEKAYEAAQHELKDTDVNLVVIGTRDFNAAGEYEGNTLLWLDAAWREPWKAQSVPIGEVGVMPGTDVDISIARSPVDVEYDLQGMGRFIERFDPPLGVLTLRVALEPVTGLLKAIYQDQYQAWEARATHAAPEDIPECYDGPISTIVKSVLRLDRKIVIRLVPDGSGETGDRK